MVRLLRNCTCVFAFTLLACDDGVSPAPRIQAVRFAREEVQVTVPGAFPTAELLGLRVDAEPGASTEVRWTSSDTIAAPIDATGFLHSCAAVSSVTITAIAKADTTKRASARVIISEPAPGIAGVTSITDMRTGLQVDASALRDGVFFNYFVSGRWTECSALALVEFAVVPASGGDAVMFARTGFPGRGDLVARAGWLTALVQNGAYVLWLHLLIPGRAAPLPLAAVPAEIRN